VTTFYTARDYTDQFANLNFIINMKSLRPVEKKTKDAGPGATVAVARTAEPVAGPSSARD
jgi:hypothetical protein